MAKSPKIISTTEVLNRVQTEIICGLLRLIPWENRTIVINKMHYFLNPDSDLPDGFLVQKVTLTEDAHYVEATIRRVNYDYLDQTIHDVTEIDENTNTCFLLDETETIRLKPIDNSWVFQNLALLKLIYDEAEKKLNDDSAVLNTVKLTKDTFNPETFTFIDLGLPSGRLWAKENAPGHYTFDEAVDTFGELLPKDLAMEELIKECKCTWDDEKRGLDITGPNGNSIFLPAAGYTWQSSDVKAKDQNGGYWTRMPYNPTYARHLNFDSDNVCPLGNGYRSFGISVRPCIESR